MEGAPDSLTTRTADGKVVAVAEEIPQFDHDQTVKKELIYRQRV